MYISKRLMGFDLEQFEKGEVTAKQFWQASSFIVCSLPTYILFACPVLSQL